MNRVRESAPRCHCGKLALRGQAVCEIHGGIRPLPKEGRRLKHIPPEILSLYGDANTPAARHLRDEIALLDTRITQLIKRVDRADPERWKRLAKMLKATQKSIDEGNPPDIATHVSDIRRIIDAQVQYDEAWDRIQTTSLAKAKLVDAQTRLRSAEASRYTREEFDRAVSLFRAAVERVCTPDQLRAIRDIVRANPLIVDAIPDSHSPTGGE